MRALLLEPGRNCATIARADRAAVLVDAADYFTAFAAAASEARSHIIVIGWDLNYYTRLHRGAEPDELGPFLQTLLANRSALELYLLTWDYSALYLRERGLWSRHSRGWRGSRVHFRLDDAHPFGGSQHQKIVVIDDQIAFAGGLDLCLARWDTPAHDPADARRVDRTGAVYGAFHDVQMMVSGPIAAALGDIARERWRRATGQSLRARVGTARWPQGIPHDFSEAKVAVSRTQPVFADASEVREVQSLYVDAIEAARRSLYFEHQFLTSACVCRALCESLARQAGPEIVVVTPEHPTSWLEQSTMRTLRARVVSRLRRADIHGRFRIYAPFVLGVPLNVHSKVMIADDVLLRVGSSNLSNRSMGHDSECDLSIVAESSRERAVVRQVRARLLAEHLGARAEECAGGSLFDVIDMHNGPGNRRLQPLADGPDVLTGAPDEPFYDSERPADAARAVDVILRGENAPVDRRPFMLGAAFLGVLLLIALGWNLTGLRDWLEPATIARGVERLRTLPLAPLWLFLAFVLATLALVPVTLLLIQAGVLLGAKLGITIALLGVAASASIGFWLGRLSSRRLIIRFAGDRLRSLDRLFHKDAILSIMLVRVFPIAPFTVINLVAGASRCHFRAFILGSLLGMAPGILALVIFGRGLYALLLAPNWRDAIIALSVMLAVFLSGLLLRGRLRAQAG